MTAFILLGVLWVAGEAPAAPAAPAAEVDTAVLVAKIVPVEGPVVDHGTILIGKGKIVALGARDKVKVPEGVAVIDARETWAMPGIVEPHCHIGLDGGLNDMVFPINPDLNTAECVDLQAPEVKKALADGVTTVNSMPGSGTNHAGFSVIFKLFGASAKDAIVRDPGCLKVAQAFNPERDTGDMGATRMGMAYMLRKLLREGREYAAAWREHGEGKRKDPPLVRRDLERVRMVFEGKIPVINHTYSGWGVAESIRLFSDEFGLKLIATHVAYGGYQVGEYAAARPTKVHIDVGPHLIDSMRIGDGRMHGIAAEFWQRGVRNLSLNTDSFTFFYSQLSPEQHLFFQASMAAHLGLPENAALRAITIEPARALNIADRVGSLAAGKDADIVLKRGELLDVTSPVDAVLVDGVVAFVREGCGVTVKAPEKPAAPAPSPVPLSAPSAAAPAVPAEHAAPAAHTEKNEPTAPATPDEQEEQPEQEEVRP